MKITLIDTISSRIIDKDQMGGYGVIIPSGFSFFPRWLMRDRKCITKIPLLSLAYLAAIFSRNGHEVTILDKGQIHRADLFIIASSIVEYKSELEIASRIKRKFPKAKICFIGPFAGYLAEEYLNFGDTVIKGEPEFLAMEISRGQIPDGLVESQRLDDLDKLPFPKWELFNYSRFSYYPIINNKPFLTMQSSRGCSFSCCYCPYLAYQKDWRTRTVENVIKEMLYLKERFGVKTILFRDPLFTLDKNRCRKISEQMLENGLDIEWACETRADLLDEDLIDIMHRAGLKAVTLGIESASPDILKKSGRDGPDMKYQENIIRHCEKKGIKVLSLYILGLLNDTVYTVRETIEYARKLNTFVAQFCILTPFPGTEFYQQNKGLIIEPNWEKFNSFTPVLRNNDISSGELMRLRNRAAGIYYFRKDYILKHFRHLFPLYKRPI